MPSTLFRHASKSSNLTIRLSEVERRNLELRAKKMNQTVGAFSRELVNRELSGPAAEHEELVSRLTSIEETLTVFMTVFRETASKLELTGMASVASSAMLANTGTATGEAATRVMVTHIQDALNAAPGIVEHQRKIK